MKASNPTPVSNYGKDHWALLAYVAICMRGTNDSCVLNQQKMRSNATRPFLSSGVAWREAHSTRLKGFFDFDARDDTMSAVAAGFQLLNHDDWDCLKDLEAAGFVEIISIVNRAVRVTHQGKLVARALQDYKDAGGQYSSFSWPDCSPPPTPAVPAREPLFHLADGSPVYRGDKLYVAREHAHRAGTECTAEFSAEGEHVTVRSANGAVPSLRISALSRHPHPQTVELQLIQDLLDVLCGTITDRDLLMFRAGRAAGPAPK